MLLFTMIEFLAMTYAFNETEVRFDLIVLVPRALFTILQVLLWRVLFTEPKVTQRDGLLIILGRRFTKQVIWFVCRVPAPIDDFPLVIHQPRHFDTDNP